MQEEIEKKTLNLAVSMTRLSVRTALKAIKLFISKGSGYVRKKRSTGKQSVKQLLKNPSSITSIDVLATDLRDMKRLGRKYGVDFAIKKDRSSYPAKYILFFRANSKEAMASLYKEMYELKLSKNSRPSIMDKLTVLKELARTKPERVQERIKEHIR